MPAPFDLPADLAFPFRVFDAAGVCIGSRRTESEARSLLRMNEGVLASHGPYRIEQVLALPTGKVVTLLDPV